MNKIDKTVAAAEPIAQESGAKKAQRPARTQPRPPEFSDEALTQRFVEQHADELRYVAVNRRWIGPPDRHPTGTPLNGGFGL
jgi:hypothetical protein